MSPQRLAILLLFVQSTGLAAQSATDWTIVPGERAGFVNATTSEQEMRRHFGTQNVRAERINIGEGQYQQALVLFPDDPEKRLEIMRHDGLNQRVRMYGRASMWQLASGLRLGLSLKDVETLNDAPFEVAGWGWDEGGVVVSWNRGKLANELRVTNVRFEPDAGILDYPMGDGARSSTDPAVRRANPTTSYVVAWLTAPPAAVATRTAVTPNDTSSPETASVDGVWSGSVIDSSGPGTVTLDLTQEGTRVSGRFKGKDPASGILLEGPIIGQIVASSLTFTLTVERGTLPRPYQSCEITLRGTAEISVIEIRGTYEGLSCGRPVQNGRLTLLKD